MAQHRDSVLRLALPPLALLAAVLVAFGSGQFSISVAELWGYGIAAWQDTAATEAHATLDTVIMQVRLPRILAAVAVGAALAVAGAAYQGMFRNPLVSPDILGVSAGAGLGAVLGIFLGLPITAVQLLAFGGGLSAVAMVYAVSRLSRQHGATLAMALSGIAIGALLGAGISLLKILA
ncbi:MAG: iron chelate uptake ABC transporter family permease subunit, partial [Neisseriaceae bacterium]|nr:iron chelate uptake ABC transporter family permease subunit [Neisseriaceae bacterium]